LSIGRFRSFTTDRDDPVFQRAERLHGILLAAVAFGWLGEAPMASERDRLGAILYKLQRA
jgi:hypothetical protein